jgi:hypothetical protein
MRRTALQKLLSTADSLLEHCMRSILAATLLAATALVSVEPAFAQGCLTAEACRAIRMQQQAAQEQAATNAQQQAAIAAQQRRRAEAERKRAAEHERVADENAKVDAETKAAALREAQARAYTAQQEADARAAALAAQQQQDASDRQQAANRQAKLDAEQQAAAQRDAQARAYVAQQEAEARAAALAAQRAAAQRDAETKAKLTEETRLANLRAAEESPDNYCKEPSTAGAVINYYNSLVRAGDAAFSAVDIEHLITEQFDKKARTMSCHGTFVLTNGNRRDGSIITRPNVAGTIIVTFHEVQY